MSIDRKHIDVEFDSVPDQETGLIEQTDDEIMAAAGDIGSFEDSYPSLMVPRAERKARALVMRDRYRASVTISAGQSRTSACVGFGSAQALETRLTRTYGKSNYVQLAGMSVYKEIGRTLMSGAMISDGMNQIVQVGALPLSTPENDQRFDLTWDRLDWNGRFPRGWEKHANEFRVTKWATAKGADEIESALLNGFTGIVGRSRHCVPYVYLDYNANDPVAIYANSWSSNWGDEGFGADSQRTYRSLTLYLPLEIVVPDFIEGLAI